MNRLQSLRSRLAALQGARAFARWATGWSAIVIAVVAILAIIFALDWSFRLEVPQRLVVLGIAFFSMLWAFRKYTLPFLGIREDLVQMALFVERQQQIDSDLVAALQFETAEKGRFGSAGLQTAVVDYVAEASPKINVFEGFDRSQMQQRAFWMAVAVAAAVAVGVLFPQHLAVFFNRLVLGNRHYPSLTRIVEVAVNGKTVLEAASWTDSQQPAEIRCAQGHPVSFRIRCEGSIPKSGTAQLVSQNQSAGRTTIDLIRQGDEPIFSGELGRLVDGVRYTLKLGDAFTDAAEILLVPLPVIEPQIKTLPPSYAQAEQPSEPTTSRQLAVLEGTKIEFSVTCTNKKALTDCVLTVKTKAATEQIPLQPTDDTRTKWSLADTNNALAVVREELQYDLQVTDADGLQLETPIHGAIRLKADRAPVVTAEVVHKVVLPSAEPVVDYRALDDFGLARLRVLVEVERKEEPSTDTFVDPTESTEGGKKVELEHASLDVLPAGKKITTNEMPAAGKYPLKLAGLKLSRGPLQKGDRVKVVVEATDDRGESEGRASPSEPLVLEISDESGVLQAISEADLKSEERLTDIIKRQLGIGESP